MPYEPNFTSGKLTGKYYVEITNDFIARDTENDEEEWGSAQFNFKLGGFGKSFKTKEAAMGYAKMNESLIKEDIAKKKGELCDPLKKMTACSVFVMNIEKGEPSDEVWSSSPRFTWDGDALKSDINLKFDGFNVTE